MQFQYIFIVYLLFEDVLPTTVESNHFQIGNVTRCPKIQVQDEFPKLENEIEKRPINEGESLVNDKRNRSRGSQNEETFETRRESNEEIQKSLKQSEDNSINLETSPVVESESIVSKLLSQSRKIGLGSSNKLWLNFPLQIGLEINKDNNENTLYRIKSMSAENDFFEFDNLFHGREYSTQRKPSSTLVSFSSPRTTNKMNPKTRLHFPFHLKPPLQLRNSSVSPSSSNNNFENTQNFEKNVTKPDQIQLNFTMTQPTTKSKTSVKSTQSHEKPVFVNTPSIHGYSITLSSLQTELPITIGSQFELQRSTTQKMPTSISFNQQATIFRDQNNIDIPYPNNLNFSTITTYPDIEHKGIISKLKDFLKSKFGKNITPPPSGFDLEGFLNNYDLNATLPFPSIEAITLTQDHEQLLKKSKLKKYLGRIFGNSNLTASSQKSSK